MSRTYVIAVIDDDESFREALAELLRSLGYDAREFASADEFIAADGERYCDGVVTDFRMPGMNGLELSRLLALRKPALPVIMITAVAEPSVRTEAAASGSFCLLEKPFDAEALIDCLRRALER